MALIVDSSVFITLERRSERPKTFEAADWADEPLVMAAITASELLAGIHLTDVADDRLRREVFVESVIESVPILEFDLAAARVHSRVWSQLTREGRMIGAHDLQIAATALAHGLSLVTENVGEFERVPGLVVRRFVL